MSPLDRFVDFLYRLPIAGKFFRVLGSVALIATWREHHSVNIQDAQRATAELKQLSVEIATELEAMRSNVATNFSQIEGQLESLSRALELQTALTSTVQQFCQEEVRKLRVASEEATTLKLEFERYLPEFFNAVISFENARKRLEEQQLGMKASVEGLNRDFMQQTTEFRDELARSTRALHADIGGTNSRLAELDRQTLQVTTALREEFWRRAGAIEGEMTALSQQVDRDRETLLEVTTALREELWRRAGAIEGEITARAQQAERDREALLELHTLIGSAFERVEFVRREIMLEVRYGRKPQDVVPPVSGTMVRDPSKLAAVDLKINVGCGHVLRAGYVNIDRRDLPGVDVVADATNLPIEPGSVAELYSSHVLEHFPQEELVRTVLPHWRTLLRDGGELRAVVPDAEAMTLAFVHGEMPYSDLREVTFGGQDYDGDFHFNMFTPASLEELLLGAGFTRVEVVARGRRNGACLEFEIVAA